MPYAKDNGPANAGRKLKEGAEKFYPLRKQDGGNPLGNVGNPDPKALVNSP
jgi:hypothetical protein